MVVARKAEQHEGELPARGERDAEVAGGTAAAAGQPPDEIEHGELDENERRSEADEQQSLLLDEAEIHRHPDGDEEKAEQQALERLQLGLDLMAELRVGEQDAREEGAQ